MTLWFTVLTWFIRRSSFNTSHFTEFNMDSFLGYCKMWSSACQLILAYTVVIEKSKGVANNVHHWMTWEKNQKEETLLLARVRKHPLMTVLQVWISNPYLDVKWNEIRGWISINKLGLLALSTITGFVVKCSQMWKCQANACLDTCCFLTVLHFSLSFTPWLENVDSYSWV